MKYKLLRFSLLSIFAMFAGLWSNGAWAADEWADIAADFTNQSFFTEADANGATAGLKMNADGTFTRVEADDATANAVISGKYHSNEHGISNFSATVKVEGPVMITFGTCAWGGNVTVKDATGTEVVPAFSTNTGACYHNNKTDNVVSAYYKGEATVLTISGGSYVPYFGVKKVDAQDIPNDAKVTFDITNVECEGVAPAEITAEIGSTITIPLNRTLFKDDFTLTAWAAATGTLYKPGDEMTVNEDITLTPVFTKNNIEDPELESFTAIWDFQQKNGAPLLNYQGKTGIYVTQTDFGGYIVDLKMDFDTTNGKIANGNWTDWCQMNGGTKLTIPAVKGMVVSIESYSATTTTTIAGSTDYTTEGNVVSYTYNGTEKFIDIVIGDGSYFRYVKVVYPIVLDNYWVDIIADFTNQSFFTEADANGATAGLRMNDDGTFTRVDKNADDADAIISGKYHSNEHGISNFSAQVCVYGPVKITFGTCAWGGDVTVKNSAGEVVATMNTNTGACYHNDKENNIVSTYYKGETDILTISGGAYVPYFAVETVDPAELKSDATVTFAAGEAEGAAYVPEAVKMEVGKAITLPKNFTMYVEGKTLTAWSDGENEYAVGSEYTIPENDVTLTAVFTANEASLADREEAVTVRWNFRRDAGAPSVQWQNKEGLVWVAQAVVNGKTIDVALPFSTNPGKFANGNWSDWAQLNQGTTFSVPSCKGAVISMEAYSNITTTTIDGQTDYTQGQTISYTIGGDAENVDIVIGDGSYYRYIQVVLPVVEKPFQPTTFDNVDASIVWALNDLTEYATPQTLEPTEAFTLATVSLDQTPNGVEAPSAGANSGIKLLKLTGDTKIAEFIVKPYRGVTFTATKVSAKVARYGTDGGTLNVAVKTAEGVEQTLASGLIPARNNKTQADDKHGSNDKYTTEFSFDLPVSVDLSTTESFTLVVTQDGLASGKQWGIGDVHIIGTVNGETEDVAKYTITAVANPEEGGSVSVYPQGDTFDEGTELKLTATEKFGYDFVNWTDADGVELSAEPVFTYTLNADAVLTANFKKVNTFELALTVDGTNDYMVSINPAPVVIDGKNMYEEGTAVQLNANGYEGLVTFTNWSDGETNSNKTIKMSEDIQLTAFYAQADIIAGWDFYRAGNSGRKADFAAQDNDADVLNLVNTETGEVQGWLDKSTIGAGGYESFAGAAVNWRTGTGNGDVGNWHWQTKVNAEAFTDINVQFQMLYNYNAYQTYNAEYSLDGESWTNFGSISMTGTKAPASFSKQLPAEANNQAELYIRMLADKTSNVDGTASANDGNTLAMFFITGSPKLVDDGKAPVLVSTVPEDGATGASASGKIVLTFDERVKVTEGAQAIIYVYIAEPGQEVSTETVQVLSPVVSGKTVTFEYKGLEYSSGYYFTMPRNTISDLTDNFLNDDITFSFTTMVRPSVDKKMYDFIVPDDGTFAQALNAAAARQDNSQRFRIFVKDGSYIIPANQNQMVEGNDGKMYADPKTYFNSPNVSIIGESSEGTMVTNEMPNALSDNPDAGANGQANPLEGIRTSGVLYLQSGAIDTYFQDIKLWSNTADATGRNVVLVDGGNRTICKNVTLWAYQDTYVSDNSRNFYYFEGGLLRGRTDFLCGSGDVFYNGVTLQMCQDGGYIAVPRDNVKYGYVFKDCTIKGETSKVDGNYYLGRPWTKGAEVYYIDTKMEVVPRGEGWANMSSDGCTRMAEYNSMTASGSVIDLSSRTKELGGNPNEPVLTAEEALEIGNLHNMFGDWDPTLATEQAPLPTKVELAGNILTWDDSQYALLWAVVKNGKVVDFTIEPVYTVDDTDAQWSVRAANEMGGLSEAVAASITTGIETIEQESLTTDHSMYNLQGIRVQNAKKGLYIIGSKKVVIK